jgi:gas vesicle protein
VSAGVIGFFIGVLTGGTIGAIAVAVLGAGKDDRK